MFEETLREELIRKKIILTYKEWYEINRDAFELVHNNLDPYDTYDEYANELVETYHQIEIERLRAKVTKLYIENFDMFEKFYFEFMTLLQDIASDVKQIMPKTDEELKECVLKY